MRFELASLLALTACASAPERPPFSLDALVADAPAYVASRYRERELPDALMEDLHQAGFVCGHRAMVDECVKSESAFASCFDVWLVRIDPAAPIHAEMNRRCTGAVAPQGQ